MANCGVYAITNTLNGHAYIGSSVNISQRWRAHINSLNKNEHHSDYLQRAWNKYGADSFEFSVLEYCGVDYLIKCEQFYINSERPEYNICLIAGSCLGVKRSEEAKRNNSEARKGKHPSAEARQNMSEAAKGKRKSAEAIVNMCGRAQSEDNKRKLLEANIGNTYTLGRKHTPEELAKLSAALKRAWAKRKAQAQSRLEAA